MTEVFQIFIALSGAIGVALMFFSLLYLRITLTRRIKHQLQPTDEYWESGTLDFEFLNTIIFALACTLPYVSRSDNFKLIYNDLDVKNIATAVERLMAYAMMIGLVSIIISCFLVAITKFTGFLVW